MRGLLSQLSLIGLTTHLANAYTNSLEDCEAFAALWSAGCGGTDEYAVYDPDSDWETSGAGVFTSNCSIEDPDDDDAIQAREPDVGTLVDSYSIFARNCVTCREDENDHIKIRVQTNNMPKHCYGSSDDSSVTSYPETKKIDIEMLWNSDVLGTRNVADSQIATADLTSSLLCDYGWSADANLPATSTMTDNDSVDIDGFVGFSMNNVLWANALTSGDDDAVQEYDTDMDFCLSSTDSMNFIKYHTMSSCMSSQASTSTVPPLCHQANNELCERQPMTFAAANFTTTDLPYETPLGIAKDGHVIVGPYNSDGELWACDDHDVCNGVFLADGSYVYALTYTFPYVVGCWGPGPKQVHAASCSTRSCSDDGAIATSYSMLSAGVLAIALLLASN